MLSDLSICRALIARKTPIILAEGGQTLLNPCIRCDVYSQSRHSSRQQGSMRGVFSVSKRGENIYKRKDGRWEGRYIKERSADGKARYAYVYGKSYADAKQKLLDRRIAQAQNISQPYKVRGYSSQLDCHVPRSYKRVDLFPIHPSCKCPHSTLLRRAANGQADYPDGRKTHLFSFEQGACR